MDQAIQDAVGKSGIADLFMPMSERQLRSQDHRPALVAIVAKLQEIAPLAVFQGSHGKIMQKQDVDAGELR